MRRFFAWTLVLASFVVSAHTQEASQAPALSQAELPPASAPAPAGSTPRLTARPPVDGRQIVLQSLQKYRRNLELSRNYTYQKREVESELDKNGKIKKTEISTYDVLMIFGKEYEKKIAKDDQALNEKDRQKEEEELNKFYAEQKKKSEDPKEQQKEAEKDEKNRREIAESLPRVLDFRVIGEEEIAGHPTWVIEAYARPDGKPSKMFEKLISKMRGKMWITKDDYQWVRIEAELLDNFSVGLFLFKFYKGSRFEFEAARVNDEVWLPKRQYTKAGGRFTFKTGRMEEETTFSNYQKFKTDTKIVGVAEMPEEKPKPN